MVPAFMFFGELAFIGKNWKIPHMTKIYHLLHREDNFNTVVLTKNTSSSSQHFMANNG